MEELLQLMEETANMLRGMTLDPSIPNHAKSAMTVRINKLEATVEKYLHDPNACQCGGGDCSECPR